MSRDNQSNASAPAHVEIQSGFTYGSKRYYGIFERPIYLVSGVLNFLVWSALIAYITVSVGETDWVFICYVPIVAWIIYMTEVCFCKTSRYLWNLNLVEDVVTYVNRMKKVAPVIGISCVCSHQEMRTRYVTETYTDSNGRTETRTRTETYWETVVTHTESEFIHFSHFEDDSGLITEGILKWNAIRIEYTKSWQSGDSYTCASIDAQIDRFHSRNRDRDTDYSYSMNMDLPGYTSTMLSLVDLSKRPFMLQWSAYVVVSMLFLFSWPYRLWFCRKTAKGRFHFQKTLYKRP